MIELGIAVEALASVFVPIGIAGAVIAVLCGALVAVALVLRADGVVGGAAGVWIVGGMLSLAATFANNWIPVTVAGGALAAGLVLGGVARAVTGRTESLRAREEAARPAPGAPAERPLVVRGSGSALTRVGDTLTLRVTQQGHIAH